MQPHRPNLEVWAAEKDASGKFAWPKHRQMFRTHGGENLEYIVLISSAFLAGTIIICDQNGFVRFVFSANSFC